MHGTRPFQRSRTWILSSASRECTRPVRCTLSLIVWLSPAGALAYYVVENGAFLDFALARIRKSRKSVSSR